MSFGLPYSMSARQAALAIIRDVVPHVRGVRIAGSAACDFLAWAHGECDAFVGCGLAEWDTAAGQAIVAAAGGAVRRVGTPDFEILVAASAPLAAELCDIVGSP
ncbi:MAG TPA: inositol monophosphatase family protein [Nakamurella sp.]